MSTISEEDLNAIETRRQDARIFLQELSQSVPVGNPDPIAAIGLALNDTDALYATIKALRAENERLNKHIADLNHDLECAIKECDEHHG